MTDRAFGCIETRGLVSVSRPGRCSRQSRRTRRRRLHGAPRPAHPDCRASTAARTHGSCRGSGWRARRQGLSQGLKTPPTPAAPAAEPWSAGCRGCCAEAGARAATATRARRGAAQARGGPAEGRIPSPSSCCTTCDLASRRLACPPPLPPPGGAAPAKAGPVRGQNPSTGSCCTPSGPKSLQGLSGACWGGGMMLVGGLAWEATVRPAAVAWRAVGLARPGVGQRLPAPPRKVCVAIRLSKWCCRVRSCSVVLSGRLHVWMAVCWQLLGRHGCIVHVCHAMPVKLSGFCR